MKGEDKARKQSNNLTPEQIAKARPFRGARRAAIRRGDIKVKPDTSSPTSAWKS